MSDPGVENADTASGAPSLEFPPEILRMIFESVDRRVDEATLLNARLVNHDWYQQSTEVLWHEPDLRMVNHFEAHDFPMNVSGISTISLTKDFDELMPVMDCLQGLRVKKIDVASEHFHPDYVRPAFPADLPLPVLVGPAIVRQMGAQFAAYFGLLKLLSDTVTSFRYHPTDIPGRSEWGILISPPTYEHLFESLSERCPRLEYLSLGSTNKWHDALAWSTQQLAMLVSVSPGIDDYLINMLKSLQALKHVDLGPSMCRQLHFWGKGKPVLDYLLTRTDLKTVRISSGDLRIEGLEGPPGTWIAPSWSCPQIRGMPHLRMSIAQASEFIELVPNAEELAFRIVDHGRICTMVQKLGSLSNLTVLRLSLEHKREHDGVIRRPTAFLPEHLMPLTSCRTLRRLSLEDVCHQRPKARWPLADKDKFLTSFPLLVEFKIDKMIALDARDLLTLGFASPLLKSVAMPDDGIHVSKLSSMSSGRPTCPFPVLTDLEVDRLTRGSGRLRFTDPTEMHTLLLLCSSMPKLERLRVHVVADTVQQNEDDNGEPFNLAVRCNHGGTRRFMVPRPTTA